MDELNMSAHASRPTALRNRRVLVADDCPEMVELLTAFLSRAGYEVDAVDNGDDVVQRMKAAAPAIALLDIEMPIKNGYDVASEVKRLPGFERIPLVALTAHDQRHDWLRTIEAGFTSYVVKPIDFLALGKLIETLCANSAEDV